MSESTPKRFDCKDHSLERNPVCVCGHGWYQHEFSWKTLLCTFRWKRNMGECERCQCPKYQHYANLNFDEERDLQRKIGTCG